MSRRNSQSRRSSSSTLEQMTGQKRPSLSDITEFPALGTENVTQRPPVKWKHFSAELKMSPICTAVEKKADAAESPASPTLIAETPAIEDTALPTFSLDKEDFPSLGGCSSSKKPVGTVSCEWGKPRRQSGKKDYVSCKNSIPERTDDAIETIATPRLMTETRRSEGTIEAFATPTLVMETQAAEGNNDCIAVPPPPTFSLAAEEFPSLGGCPGRRKPAPASFSWRYKALVKSINTNCSVASKIKTPLEVSTPDKEPETTAGMHASKAALPLVELTTSPSGSDESSCNSTRGEAVSTDHEDVMDSYVSARSSKGELQHDELSSEVSEVENSASSERRYSFLQMLAFREIAQRKPDETWSTIENKKLPRRSLRRKNSAGSPKKTRSDLGFMNRKDTWRCNSAEEVMRDSGARLSLKKCETAWSIHHTSFKPHGANDMEEAKAAKKIKGILNKLTEANFDVLVGQLMDIGLTTKFQINILCSEIFEKATTQHGFIDLYSRLCKHLLEAGLCASEGATFRSVLVHTCQAHFEKCLVPPDGMLDNKIEDADAFERELKYKSAMLGNIKLVGTLLCEKLVASQVLIGMAHELFRLGTQVSIESLCVLLSRCGASFDSTSWTLHSAFNQLFADLEEFAKKNKTIGNRIKFLVKDVLDLRQQKWVAQK